MTTFVRYELADGIATITLEDGKVNAFGFAMQEQLSAALDQAEAAGAAVLLTSAGKAFSAGFDLSVVKAGGPEVPRMIMGGRTLGERLLNFPRPVVMAAGGHAMAMGAILLLCADYRIGIDSGARVQMTETSIGMTMPHFGIALAHGRLAGSWQVRAYVNAEPLSTAQAVSAGFLDEIVPAEQLAATALTRVKALAALHAGAFVATRARLYAPMQAALTASKAVDAAELHALYASA